MSKIRNDCAKCGGKCCQQIFLPLSSTITSTMTADEIRWINLHKKMKCVIRGEVLCVRIDNPCGYVLKNGQCAIYKERPQVCRNFKCEI